MTFPFEGEKTLSASANLQTAIECLEDNKMKIVFVLDEEGGLIGSVTDGDIRRALIAGKDLNQLVSTAMNKSPIKGRSEDSVAALHRFMRQNDYRYVPIVNEENKIIRIETLNDVVYKNEKENWVFLMAGGFGKRLRPLTDETPKPMLPVGGRPILESIIAGFLEYGFKKFCISLHYRGDLIRNHFGDGSKWGVEIDYVEEMSPLGTAGALGLFEKKTRNPLIIMNGDILTKVNFEELLDFHERCDWSATVCVREHRVQVPYGTLELDGQEVLEIQEKPAFNFFINAGIYVLEPNLIDRVKAKQQLDMPDFLSEVKALPSHKVGAFPIHEYWLDMGEFSQFEQAQVDYAREFQ